MVGFEHSSDAGVYRLDAERALVQSVDFFTPIVDDPRTFGRIAAANALSDLYAMGAEPRTALAIVCFPSQRLDAEVLLEILLGGAETVREAGALLVGGHSVMDPELKYGLSVTGLVHPERLRTNAAARPGDQLVLTKPLGTGLIANALKAGKVAEDDPRVREAIDSMAALNAVASAVFARHGVRCSTDVTGFGLLGHAHEVALASGVALTLRSAALPVFELALELAEAPLGGGSRDNELAADAFTERAAGHSTPHARLAADAQTSGGLLGCVPPAALEAVLEDLRAAGVVAAAHVGEVSAGTPGRIRLV